MLILTSVKCNRCLCSFPALFLDLHEIILSFFTIRPVLGFFSFFSLFHRKTSLFLHRLIHGQYHSMWLVTDQRDCGNSSQIDTKSRDTNSNSNSFIVFCTTVHQGILLHNKGWWHTHTNTYFKISMQQYWWEHINWKSGLLYRRLEYKWTNHTRATDRTTILIGFGYGSGHQN